MSFPNTLTGGGATVLWVLGESNGPLNPIFLHLFNGFFRQGVDVAETDVILVRGWKEKSAGELPANS